MEIKWAVSNRHCHLTQEDADRLGIDPKPWRWLGIGENYASDTHVFHIGEKFRVLLPFRNYSQVEMLASDCRRLGIASPVFRRSGSLENTPTLDIWYLNRHIKIPAIVAIPHLHVPEDWGHLSHLRLFIDGNRPVSLWAETFPSPEVNEPVLHIDKDEAYAFGLEKGHKVFFEPTSYQKDIQC